MYKLINKTTQTFILTNYGYLYPYAFIIVKEITEQIKSMEKRMLITIKIMPKL